MQLLHWVPKYISITLLRSSY